VAANIYSTTQWQVVFKNAKDSLIQCFGINTTIKDCKFATHENTQHKTTQPKSSHRLSSSDHCILRWACGLTLWIDASWINLRGWTILHEHVTTLTCIACILWTMFMYIFYIFHCTLSEIHICVILYDLLWFFCPISFITIDCRLYCDCMDSLWNSLLCDYRSSGFLGILGVFLNLDSFTSDSLTCCYT